MAQNTPDIFNTNDSIQNIATLLDNSDSVIAARQMEEVAKDSLATQGYDFLSLKSTYDNNGRLQITAVVRRKAQTLSGTAPAPAPPTPAPLSRLDGKHILSGYE